MCLYPKQVINKKYTSTKKNGGVIPTINDYRTKYINAECGNCIECRKKKAREWQIRLTEELKENKNAIFITLTFNNESIYTLTQYIKSKGNILTGYNLDNKIASTAVRLFLERWRKLYKKSLKHWLVTEIGQQGTENIHLHGIIWTDKPDQISNVWKYGYVWDGKMINEQKINYVSNKTIGYITKYILKRDIKHLNYKSIILTSKGIGKRYVTTGTDKEKNKYNGENTRQYYRTSTGHKIALPSYYRKKIYTETEREQLWINSLNKGEITVLGQKTKTQEEYEIAIKSARERNKMLGYGDDTIDIEKQKQQRDERNKNHKIRMAKGKKNAPQGF